MPEIYLDGRKIDFGDTGAFASLGELANAIEQELRSDGRFIAGFEVDGKTAGDWRKDSISGAAPSECKKLRLTTAPVEDFRPDGVEAVKEHIKFLKAATEAVLKELRLVGSCHGVDLNPVFNGSVKAVKAIDAVSRNLKPGNPALAQDPASYYKPLFKVLDGLRDAKRLSDHDRLLHLLANELSPLLKEIPDKLFNQPKP